MINVLKLYKLNNHKINMIFAVKTLIINNYVNLKNVSK